MTTVGELVERIDEQVDLDVAHAENETWQEACAELTDGLDVRYALVVENGPGGGWPLVRFSGTDDELMALNARYNDTTHQPVVVLPDDS